MGPCLYFFWYLTDYGFVISTPHILCCKVGLITKEGLVEPRPQSSFGIITTMTLKDVFLRPMPHVMNYHLSSMESPGVNSLGKWTHEWHGLVRHESFKLFKTKELIYFWSIKKAVVEIEWKQWEVRKVKKLLLIKIHFAFFCKFYIWLEDLLQDFRTNAINYFSTNSPASKSWFFFWSLQKIV